MWDEYKKEHFNLRAIIFCTINDNPACLAITGQVKGKSGCVVCVDLTASKYLTVHETPQILTKKPQISKMDSLFDGTTKSEMALLHRDGNGV